MASVEIEGINKYTFVEALEILKHNEYSKTEKKIAIEIVDSRSDLATKEELEFIESKIKEMKDGK